LNPGESIFFNVCKVTPLEVVQWDVISCIWISLKDMLFLLTASHCCEVREVDLVEEDFSVKGCIRLDLEDRQG
jgi:hypothetical protein